MKLIKFIVLIISTLCIFCSCGNTSEKKVRALKVIYLSGSNTFTPTDSTIYNIYVDTAYRTGDMLIQDYTRYKIID